MVARLLALLTLGLLGGACVPMTPCEDLDVTIGQSEEGLVVTPSEHPDGWGRGDCEACHPVEVVHFRECTDGVDYDRLWEQLQGDGYDACGECHGTNGTEP